MNIVIGSYCKLLAYDLEYSFFSDMKGKYNRIFTPYGSTSLYYNYNITILPQTCLPLICYTCYRTVVENSSYFLDNLCLTAVMVIYQLLLNKNACVGSDRVSLLDKICIKHICNLILETLC